MTDTNESTATGLLGRDFRGLLLCVLIPQIKHEFFKSKDFKFFTLNTNLQIAWHKENGKTCWYHVSTNIKGRVGHGEISLSTGYFHIDLTPKRVMTTCKGAKNVERAHIINGTKQRSQ